MLQKILYVSLIVLSWLFIAATVLSLAERLSGQ